MDEVLLGQLYEGVTLSVNHDVSTFANMRGVFEMQQLPTGDGHMTLAPVFQRIFPEHEVTYGLHTPSQRMDLLIQGKCFSPQSLRSCGRAGGAPPAAALS